MEPQHTVTHDKNSIIPDDFQEKSDNNVSKKTPESNQQEAFSSIKLFVEDLWEVYGTKTVTPLACYKRLIDKADGNDPTVVQKFTESFILFFDRYANYIYADDLDKIPDGTQINFGDGKKAFILIKVFIKKAQKDVKESIRQHLLTISGLLQPEKIIERTPSDELGIDTSTTEGKFIGNILTKAKKNMENVNIDNPMQATMALFQSGIMSDMIAGLQNGVENGNMDLGKMMATMQNAMSNMMKDVNTTQQQKPEEKK